MLVLLNFNMQKVYAQVVYSETGDTVTLESAAKGEDPENVLGIKISNIEKNDVITIESDAPEIVGFNYSEDEEDDYVENADRLEFGVGNNKVKDGKWQDYFTILARQVGSCNVTVSVNGVPDRIFKVQVNPTKPVVSLDKRTIWNVDASDEIKFDGISPTCEISISSNKSLRCAYGFNQSKYVNIGKNTKQLNVAKLDENGFCINPKMKKMQAGTYKINVTVKQDGESYPYVLTLRVKNYVSPFQSFKIGNVDLTKTFKKHRTISDANYGKVSLATAKKTLGGQRLSIKMKKGYSVYNITYRKKDEWGTKPHRITNVSTLKDGTVVVGEALKPDFWELYIYYKKGNKKMGYDCVYWSYAVFN